MSSFKSDIEKIKIFIKKCLKEQGLTYKDLGLRLEIYEPSVKRLMNSDSLSLNRLYEIASLFGMDIFQLIEKAKEYEPPLVAFNNKQEVFFSETPVAFYICLLLSVGFSKKEVFAKLDLCEAEFNKLLKKLDDCNLVEIWGESKLRMSYRGPCITQLDGPVAKKFHPKFLKALISRISEKRSGAFLERGEVYMTADLRKKMERDFAELEKQYYSLARLQQGSVPIESLEPVSSLIFIEAFNVWEQVLVNDPNPVSNLPHI